jgi:hypothetical protein
MTGPPAAVATPPGIELGARHGGPYLPPPAGQGGGSRKTLLAILAGVLALALAGGMVWLLLNFNGDRGGATPNPGGDQTTGTVEDENAESEDPTPTSSPSADDDDDDDDDDDEDDEDDDDDDDNSGPSFGCLLGANCDN